MAAAAEEDAEKVAKRAAAVERKEVRKIAPRKKNVSQLAEQLNGVVAVKDLMRSLHSTLATPSYTPAAVIPLATAAAVL